METNRVARVLALLLLEIVGVLFLFAGPHRELARAQRFGPFARSAKMAGGAPQHTGEDAGFEDHRSGVTELDRFVAISEAGAERQPHRPRPVSLDVLFPVDDVVVALQTMPALRAGKRLDPQPVRVEDVLW